MTSIRPVVLFLDEVHVSMAQELESIGYSCRMEYTAAIKDLTDCGDIFGIVIRSRVPLDEKAMLQFPYLRWIARSGSGMENIDVAFAESRGIRCYNAAQANAPAVAEHALGMLFCLARNIVKSDNEVRRGVWLREENRGWEVRNQRIGIVGWGNNGSQFGELMQRLGCRVYSYDKYKTHYAPDGVVECDSLANLVKSVDILSLHIPQNGETIGSYGADFFENILTPLVFINTSRGKIVQTKALLKAVETGKIRGACLDVLEEETSGFHLDIPQGSALERLLAKPQVVATPHIAGWTKESLEGLSRVLLQQIRKDFDFMTSSE